jgi:sterol desaturase/sphingolipid hydroxylase (fatty acid hydroxylase superfamily)
MISDRQRLWVFLAMSMAGGALIFVEWAYVKIRHRQYDVREGLQSFGTYVGDVVVNALVGGGVLAALRALYLLAPIHLIDLTAGIAQSGLGRLLYGALLFVAMDLTFYISHRLSHRVPLLWAVHQVHHSARTFNFTVAARQSWFSAILQPFWWPLALLGFEPTTVLLGQFVHFAAQLWVHTEQVPSLGPLEWVLNTPRHHQVHHASNPQYLDRNFGGLLIVWDRLFGTFVENVEPPRYGIEPDPCDRGILAVVFGGWMRLLRRRSG